MTDSEILWQAYNQYFLLLGGKKVPTPYRSNLPYQSDPRKYGKSSPGKLTQDVLEIAKEQNFDLESASIEEIRDFMEKNLLGIDCSGYIYHCLDYLLKQHGKGGMLESGLPWASKTNVKRFTFDEYSAPVLSIDQIHPGDFITFKSGPGGHHHILLIMENTTDRIIYTQSSGLGKITGVQQNTITIIDSNKSLKDQLWDEKLANGKNRVDYFLPEQGDGARRLKAMQ